MTFRTQLFANLVAAGALLALTLAIPLVDQVASRLVAELPVPAAPAAARAPVPALPVLASLAR